MGLGLGWAGRIASESGSRATDGLCRVPGIPQVGIPQVHAGGFVVDLDRGLIVAILDHAGKSSKVESFRGISDRPRIRRAG